MCPPECFKIDWTFRFFREPVLSSLTRMFSVFLVPLALAASRFVSAGRILLTLFPPLPLTDAYVEPYNTFDGPGFPACNNVLKVYRPSTVSEIVSIVKNATSLGQKVRASGVSSLFLVHFKLMLNFPVQNGHMWCKTTPSPHALCLLSPRRHYVLRRPKHRHHQD